MTDIPGTEPPKTGEGSFVVIPMLLVKSGGRVKELRCD